MHVVKRVPHGSDDLRHFAETRARVLTFDCRLSVAEKQRICRHRPATFHNSIIIITSASVKLTQTRYSDFT